MTARSASSRRSLHGWKWRGLCVSAAVALLLVLPSIAWASGYECDAFGATYTRVESDACTGNVSLTVLYGYKGGGLPPMNTTSYDHSTAYTMTSAYWSYTLPWVQFAPDHEPPYLVAATDSYSRSSRDLWGGVGGSPAPGSVLATVTAYTGGPVSVVGTVAVSAPESGVLVDLGDATIAVDPWVFEWAFGILATTCGVVVAYALKKGRQR